jgi:peroxiredoxin
LPAYNADYDKFAGLDAQVVGISCDSIYCHIGWQEKDIGLLNFPLVSDFYPHAAVIQKYGILRTGPPLPGIGERAIFVVDKKGKIAFVKLYELGEQPPNEEVLAALSKLQSPKS